MKKVVFYHFLTTKEKEEENRRNGKDPHVHEWEIVEARVDSQPIGQFVFPWKIKKVLSTKDLGTFLGLSPEQVWDNILRHWDESNISRLTNHGDGIPILIRDMDTNTDHFLFFRMWIDCGRFTIEGNWNEDFVERRGLKEGMLLGMYWDMDSSSLHFSVLDDLRN